MHQLHPSAMFLLDFLFITVRTMNVEKSQYQKLRGHQWTLDLFEVRADVRV